MRWPRWHFPAWVIRLDKWVARRVGWTGTHTISAECGRRLPPLGHKYCLICRLLRWIDLQHCTDAARDEGLYAD